MVKHRIASQILLLPLLLLGCGEVAFNLAEDAGTSFSEQVRGEALLFVGTDPSSLATDLYLVTAASSSVDSPSLTTAESYELEQLTDTENPDEALELGSYQLFSLEQPHPIPDRSGDRFALITQSVDEQSGNSINHPAVYDLTTRSLQQGPAIQGLHSIHFSDQGASLALSARSEEGGETLLMLPADELDATPVLLQLEADESNYSYEFAGPIPASDDILALRINEDEAKSQVLRVDSLSGEAEVLSGALEGLLDQASLSADGQLLAVTVHHPENNYRAVAVIDKYAQIHTITENLSSNCYWPVWAPIHEKLGQRLSFVCQDAISGRPDIGMWSAEILKGLDDEVGDAAALDYAADLLTTVSQPAIFEGTMDGLVVRSSPQWSPNGNSLVFGVSTHEEALAGTGMSLLVLPLSGTAYPIYSGSGTSVDWAHFSQASDDQSLLLWERSATGLESTRRGPESQPIRMLTIDQPEPQPIFVRLDQDLLVSYPMFLGGNSLFY